MKTEQARLYLRQMDIELTKEQSKLVARQPSLYPVYTSPHQQQQQQQQQHQQPYAYYSLAPVQQQVLARITGGSSATDHHHHHHPPHTSVPQLQQQHQQHQQHYQQQSSRESGHYNHPPPSPVVYPYSAHPLCPPDTRLNPPPPRHYQSQTHLLPINSSQQPTTPISPGGGGVGINPNDDFKSRKRSHASILLEEDKLSHNKVMEALKAKIQRGNSSPLATTAPSSAFRSHADKRQRTLPKPTITTEVPPILTHPHHPHHQQHQQHHHHTPPPSTPSPRSAKPILPPIDTNVGRIPTKNLPSHPPPPLSPMKTSSPPHAAISSIRSSHVYNNDSNSNNSQHHHHNTSSSSSSPTLSIHNPTNNILPSISDHQK